jgi:hypothetical protein
MITVQNDTLSDQLISDILSWNRSTQAGDVWATNQTKWVESLKYATTGVILSRVMPEEYASRIYDELQTRNKIDYSPWSRSCLFYIGLPNSCVNWHADYNDYNAMSIYLNSEWHSNWGGWFAYTDKYNYVEGEVNPEDGRFIVPRYNLSVLSTEMEWHRTTPMSPIAQPRYSIQLFFSKKGFNAQ